MRLGIGGELVERQAEERAQVEAQLAACCQAPRRVGGTPSSRRPISFAGGAGAGSTAFPLLRSGAFIAAPPPSTILPLRHEGRWDRGRGRWRRLRHAQLILACVETDLQAGPGRMRVDQAIQCLRAAARDALEAPHGLATLVADDQPLTRELLEVGRFERRAA